MAIDLIDLGTTPNDGTGDPARTAFGKCNSAITSIVDSSLHGVVLSAIEENPITPAVTINTDITKTDITAVDYYIAGTKYTFAGETARAGAFSAGESRYYMGLDASGIVEQDTDWTDTQLKTIIPIGRAQAVSGQSGAGSDIETIRDDRYIVNHAGYYERLERKNNYGAVYDFAQGNGVITENGSTPFQLDVAALSYCDLSSKSQTVAQTDDITGFRMVSYAPFLLSEGTIVNPQQYDDGSALVNLDTGRWAVHSLMRSVNPEGSYFLKISTAQYVTREDAKKQQFDFGIFGLSDIVPVAKIVVKEGAAGIDTIVDHRPVIARHVAQGVSDGVSNIDNFANGAVIDDIITSITSSGSVVTFSVERDGGDDVRVQFNGTNFTLETDPTPDTVVLTAGSDTSPTANFIYITESSGVLTLTSNTTGFPATTHAPIATSLIQSALGVQTDGAYKHHQWNNEIGNGNGHLVHANAWIRSQNATWLSGVDPTSTVVVQGVAIDNLYFSNVSGTVLQLHKHVMPARDMQTGDEAFVVNDSTTAYDRVTDLSTIDTDSLGATLRGNNTYYSLVVFAVASQNEADCKLYVNTPSGSYSNSTDALNDPLNYSNTAMPDAFIGTGFLVARIVIRHQTADSGTITVVETKDLRRASLVGGGGTSAVGTEFSDNLFRIFNVADNTKEIDYDLSAISTATTRTITMPDEDVDLGAFLDNIVDDTTPQLGGALDTNSKAINESEGAPVASATTTEIFGGDDGNTLHITGTTTITDFTDASSVGQWRKIIFDGILTLTHGSGITLQGGANITTAAGDFGFVYADAVDAFRVVYFKADGTAVAGEDKTVNIIGSTGGGTQDIDLDLGRAVSATVDTSTNTFTFSNPLAAGKDEGFTLYLTNGGSQTVNWSASVAWAGGAAPTLTASGVDILVFTTIDGGTIWNGFASGLDVS